MVGSPAHAGMDPVAIGWYRDSTGLPRTRGDGPGSTAFVHGVDAAPPHTRGWTRMPALKRLRGEGSPAHAGMDPGRYLPWWMGHRLPRTRGDGPPTPIGAGFRPRAPPHTRGWTLGGWPSGGFYIGSPAHAGMDPPPGKRWATTRRLPRTRGDGPRASRPCWTRSMAPPHTRGWTYSPPTSSSGPTGSPAHAGMDPSRMTGHWLSIRLPRTRGDGPAQFQREENRATAPPHTRGWTPGIVLTRLHARGSPAHAGMDPDTGRCYQDNGRLPRTRGDGPLPADSRDVEPQAPPHTRGWTPGRESRNAERRGSPAHAGMDPGRSGGPRHRGRLPRTRGDGPRHPDVRLHHHGAPPHTRGWTGLQHWRAASARGSPAHAGMDPC